jgi:hypothetical protein
MSGMRHATISAWQRHEDGSYAAELHGWTLHVSWHPEEHGQRGFSWQAEQGETKIVNTEIHEEIEVAMAAAEAHADPGPGHDADEPAAAEGGDHGHHH